MFDRSNRLELANSGFYGNVYNVHDNICFVKNHAFCLWKLTHMFNFICKLEIKPSGKKCWNVSLVFVTTVHIFAFIIKAYQML